MNPELSYHVHQALKKLASSCDGAHERDDVGFSANHTQLGRQLANAETLSDHDAWQGLQIVKHYHRQLGDSLDIIEALEIESSLESPPPVPTALPSVPPPAFTLTSEQTQAAELIMSFVDGDDPREEYKLGGFAGTGKTTLAKYLIKELHRKGISTSVMAFTGKAVNVLRRKEVWANTIHSQCYDVIEDEKTHEVTFERKITMIDDPDFIIIDEASMISGELYQTLKSYGKKILFIGDPGQLPPVGDNPNLMREPDFTLQQIHRQAAESPIIAFATVVRQGGTVVYQQRPGLIVRKKEITSPEFLACDQVICAKNQTRKMFNERIRQFQKYPARSIIEGDKLICLRNNTSFGVFNGMIFFLKVIKDCNGFVWKTECEDELGKKWFLPIWCEPFRDPGFDEKKARIPREAVYCDFGYCITCHKSQGSEWDKVMIWDEWMPPYVWDMKRWRYTAITRAAKELVFNV